jgi:aspartate/glutamate racemase
VPHTGILAANPDGAAHCFVTYCRLGAERLGGHTYPDVTLDYIALGHSLGAWLAGDVATATGNLARSVERLAAAGAEFFVCPDNNAHLALDVVDGLALPGLHIGEVVADAAETVGARRVGLLGSAFVLGSDLYRRRLGARGIEVEAPTGEDRERLHHVVLEELPDGRATDATRAWFVDLIGRLGERGCDAVALVSTELHTLLPPGTSPLPVVDSATALGHRMLEVALGDLPLPTWRGGPGRSGG